jgi:fructoselysine-6-P-deglycase FrlB-like protein
MDSVEVTDKQDLTQLRAVTSLMMTHFMIMQRLQQLLAHPSTEQITGSREIYVQLLEHWQTIYNNLLTQDEARLYFVKNSYTTASQICGK